MTIFSFFHSFYLILLFRNFFHYFIFQLTGPFFCFRYSAIDSFQSIFNFSNCVFFSLQVYSLIFLGLYQLILAFSLFSFKVFDQLYYHYYGLFFWQFAYFLFIYLDLCISSLFLHLCSISLLSLLLLLLFFNLFCLCFPFPRLQVKLNSFLEES